MAFRSAPPWEHIDRNVAARYRTFAMIGRGCYGIVWEASRKVEDAIEQELDDEGMKALKKILYAFRDAYDAQRTYREISYLKLFGDHDNILRLHEVMLSRDKKHVYLATDLLDSDLLKALKCQSLQPVHKPLVAYQVLRGLKYIHSASVMHRDIKPSNILLRRNGDAVLADFGWARSSPVFAGISEEERPLMTEYASTRWYRAPEMLLGGRMYSLAIDMWAFGCVVGEMHLETPFLPGTSTLDMLTRIEELLGRPLPNDIDSMDAPYASLALEVIPAGPPQKPVEWLLREKSPTDELVDFLKLCFQYNPAKRFLASEALTHPYLGSYHNPDSEPAYPHDKVELSIPDEEFGTAVEYRDHVRLIAKGEDVDADQPSEWKKWLERAGALAHEAGF